MKPSICTAYFAPNDPETAILALQEAGFSHGEFDIDHSAALLSRGDDPEKTGLEFRAFLENIGFSIPQGHLHYKNDLTTRQTVEALKKEIVMFQAIGIKHAVLHINGGLNLPEEERLEKQFVHLRELLEFVQGTDFTFCLENLMTNPTITDANKLLQWIHKLGGKNLGICLDTGHLHYAKQGLHATEQTHKDFILTAGNYLKALHLHDNDGTGDQHLAPYAVRGNGVNWGEVVTALRQVGYTGLFNLEVPGVIDTYRPTPILKCKLRCMKDMIDYMLSDEFIKEVCL